ncbi:hypothetical protein V2I01_41510 [Micromonospora sp. BRA006-A]|nr:hypothetical protein [Micromonospora sp. BRA006-A]
MVRGPAGRSRARGPQRRPAGDRVPRARRAAGTPHRPSGAVQRARPGDHRGDRHPPGADPDGLRSAPRHVPVRRDRRRVPRLGSRRGGRAGRLSTLRGVVAVATTRGAGAAARRGRAARRGARLGGAVDRGCCAGRGSSRWPAARTS